MKSRKLAIVLAAMMTALSLASCGSDSSTGTTETTSTANSSTGSSASDGSSDSADAAIDLTTAKYADVEGKFEHQEVSLPLCEEKETLTIFTGMNSSISSLVSDYNEIEYFQQLEEKTNVHIEWQIPALGNESTAYSLMLNSGTLPDIMRTYGNGYPDGLDASVEDGYFVDLTDYMEEYMPNYLAVVSSDKSYYNCGRTDSGKFVGVYQIMNRPQGSFFGYYVREDWLDELGLDMPVTYDDWENILLAFKEEKGCTAALSMVYTGYESYNDSLSRGFGVLSTMMLDEDGKTVVYGPNEDGWKDYVTLMHKWYDLGLVDPDYMSGSSIIIDSNLITSGATGLFPAIYTLVANYETQSTDSDCLITAVPAPLVNASDYDNLGGVKVILGSYATISADSDKKELAMKWIDYHYSEEGYIFDNYGVEGDTFTYDDDGTPSFTDKILNNEDGLTFAQAMAYYTMHPSAIVWQAWDRELASVPEKDILCYNIWDDNNSSDRRISSSMIQMTTEESTEYSKIMADVESLRDEKTNQFITGVLDIETDYDAYLDQMEQLGIDRACEIYQAAYNRYLAK